MTMRPYSLKVQLAALSILAGAAVVGVSGAAFAVQTGTINVSASVPTTCNIVTAADSGLGTALTTALTSTGAQTVTVGTVTQNCNKKAGFTLTVSSTNCTSTVAGASAGAKLVNAATVGSEEYQTYSVTFTNPTGTNPSGLLASACTAALGRDVTGAKVADQSSTIGIAFTTGVNGAAGEVAGAGTFSDTLTIDMTVK